MRRSPHGTGDGLRPASEPDGERDSLQRFLFEKAHVRGELVRLDEAWREVLRRRDYPPSVREVLGDLMAACALLAATLKIQGGELVLQIQGGGPVTLLVVECRADLTLRATARFEPDLAGLEERATLRALTAGGQCAITIDPGPGRQAYQGVVSLRGATAAEALEEYMARSEQIETRFWLAADGQRAAGLLLQRLPDHGGKATADADDDLWNRVTVLGHTLTREELLELPGRDILRRLFHDEELRVFESLPVRFACRCSRETVAGIIRMVGREEVEAVLAERGSIEIACEFCAVGYTFDREQALTALADRSASTPPPATSSG
ncbi:MAG: Hsp33 family molecular chaperone HslO [Vicinamibacteria bacterium]|nr:Hsp33 family molecular chaperone HslO [Vicinamibacteria bacterium]